MQGSKCVFFVALGQWKPFSKLRENLAYHTSQAMSYTDTQIGWNAVSLVKQNYCIKIWASVLFKSTDSACLVIDCARKGLLLINSFICNSFLHVYNEQDQWWNSSGLLGQWTISSFLTSALLFLFTWHCGRPVQHWCLAHLIQSLEVVAELTRVVQLYWPWGGNGWARSCSILKVWGLKGERGNECYPGVPTEECIGLQLAFAIVLGC